jgi:hypothetical protein
LEGDVRRTELAFVLALLSVAPHALDADSGQRGQEAKGLLQSLAKTPGPHIERIKAMGDNSWINLGQAAPCSRFPRKKVARGRAWAGKMAFVPELRGAFFCGTGSHGAVPDGYYMDDLWFYDVNAHKWICLYPGATKLTQLKLDENGFEVTLEGVQNPVSYLSHAYCNTTYVDHLRKYMLIHRPCPWWTRALPQRAKWLGIPDGAKLSYNYGKLNMNCRHPIYWDVNENQWQRTFVRKKGGPEKSFCGVLEYVPSMKQALSVHYGKVWFYDFEKEEWTDSGIAKGPSGYDSNACLDREAEKMYLASGKTFHVLNIKARKWDRLEAEGQPENLGNTNGKLLLFDSANGVVLFSKAGGEIWTYDPETSRWTDMGKTTPKIPWKRYNPKYMLAHGFYDPELNVHFIYRAGDSGSNDATWLAYRYKRR